jgi:hypothetical protein
MGCTVTGMIEVDQYWYKINEEVTFNNVATAFKTKYSYFAEVHPYIIAWAATTTPLVLYTVVI